MFDERIVKDEILDIYFEIVTLLHLKETAQDKLECLEKILVKVNVENDSKEDLKVIRNILIAANAILTKVNGLAHVIKRNQIYKDNCNELYNNLIKKVKEPKS